MSLRAIAKEAWVKILGTIAAAAITVGIPWLASHLVTKGDLENFAVMIGEEVRAEVEPLAEQTRVNTASICTGRRATLRAAIRDLKVELQEMSKERGSEAWANRDEALYQEWDLDLEEAQEELGTLNCQP